MLKMINVVMLIYIVPMIIAYIFAKLYYRYAQYISPTLTDVVLILCPVMNVFAIIGIQEWLDNVKFHKKNGRTIGERFFRIKR